LEKEQWPQVWHQDGVVSLHFLQSAGDDRILDGAILLKDRVDSLLVSRRPEDLWDVSWNVSTLHGGDGDTSPEEREWALRKSGMRKCGSLYDFHQSLIGGGG